MTNQSIYQPAHQTLKVILHNGKTKVFACGQVVIDRENNVIEAEHPINAAVIFQYNLYRMSDKGEAEGTDVIEAYVMNAAGKTVERYQCD